MILSFETDLMAKTRKQKHGFKTRVNDESQMVFLNYRDFIIAYKKIRVRVQHHGITVDKLRKFFTGDG